MNRESESFLPRLTVNRLAVRIMEPWISGAGDVDADHPPALVVKRLLEEYLVHAEVERPVEADNDACFHGVLEEGPVETTYGRHHDVVQILLPTSVSLHRVEAELEEGDVVLSVGTRYCLVHRP